MERNNYGLALSSTGDYKVVSTSASPGIKDDYSEVRSESFSFFIAPHKYVDKKLGLDGLTGESYPSSRKYALDYKQRQLRDVILGYHNYPRERKKPTWAK